MTIIIDQLIPFYQKLNINMFFYFFILGMVCYLNFS